MNRLYALLLALFCVSSLTAQRLDHVLGEVLVQLEEDTDLQDFLRTFAPRRQATAPLQLRRSLRTPGGIHCLHFNQNQVHEDVLLDQLRRHPQVRLAQFNHLLEYRQSTPNDPQFGQQWQWTNRSGTTGSVDADLAWDISTGGSTPQGDEIVVAIIDNGTERNHPDLAGSHWVNSGEIPNNGIDDDGNGYVDDYHGWNINAENDEVDQSSFGNGHGVTVAGMAGAVGNNAEGVTGVNWQVKLMTVKNDQGIDEARVLEAYAYIHKMRQLYNDTDGAKGAFVVATNASWGIDRGDPEDAPIWCGFYDILGEVGILNCGATSNASINVDQLGDLPTTCTSDFFVGVARTGANREQSGGFGPIHIDLGAPGIGVLSTRRNGGYGSETGTSLASPLVAGMIGFLYSIPNNQLTLVAKADPPTAALLARSYLLDGVLPVEGFDDLVASGGIANLYQSTQQVVEDATACLPPFGLKILDRTDVQLRVQWTPGNGVTSSQLRWRPVSSSTWENEGTVTSPHLIAGLSPCTDYEFQVAAECSGESSGFSTTAILASDGCCVAPGILTLDDLSETNAQVSWTAVFAATAYEVSLRAGNGGPWMNFTSATNSYTLDNLVACEAYEVRIRSICDGSTTDFGDLLAFTTPGCGNCEDLPYCELNRSTEYEYIETVRIGSFTNTSGDDQGYAKFFGLALELKIGETYSTELTPGYPGFNYTEDFELWIDFNQDGDFDDPGEDLLFFDNVTSTTTGEITIPTTAPLGTTRLRVSVTAMGPGEASRPSSEGETEDYCVTIIGDNNSCTTPLNPSVQVIDDFTAQVGWEIVPEADSYLVIWKKASSGVWEERRLNDIGLRLEDLSFCSDYELRVQSACSDGDSPFSNNISFRTTCLSSTQEAEANTLDFQVFPNPFHDQLLVQFDGAAETEYQVRLMSIEGRLLEQERIDVRVGQSQAIFPTATALPAGMYLIQIVGEEGMAIQRLVKR